VTAWADILASRYRLGGRIVGEHLDCYGVTLAVAKRLGLCLADAWESVRRDWVLGTLEASTGFPQCWHALHKPQPLAHGDVLLWNCGMPHVGIVADGYLWSADRRLGSAYAKRIDQLTVQPLEVWRHDSTRCS
jgi:cell wall-associated NlpC family hydrolase